jgi:hypothetical protein
MMRWAHGDDNLGGFHRLLYRAGVFEARSFGADDRLCASAFGGPSSTSTRRVEPSLINMSRSVGHTVH